MSGFMTLQVWQEAGEVLLTDVAELGSAGSIIPASVARANADEFGTTSLGKEVWFAEYATSGYSDCTGFVYSEEGPIAAAHEAFSLFGDDHPSSGDRRELAQLIWQCRAQGYRK